MLPDYYEVIRNTVFVFKGQKRTLHKALVCPDETTAKDALMLLQKAYCSEKIASLVNGVWNN